MLLPAKADTFILDCFPEQGRMRSYCHENRAETDAEQSLCVAPKASHARKHIFIDRRQSFHVGTCWNILEQSTGITQKTFRTKLKNIIFCIHKHYFHLKSGTN